MTAVHVFPGERADGSRTWAHLVADGRASALFAVLAGVGLALLSGGVRPRLDARGYGAVVVRAVLVAGVGLALGELDSDLAVILAYYGVLFLVALPLLRLPVRALVALSGLVAVLGPVAAFVLRPTLTEPPPDNPTMGQLLDDPGGLLSTLLVTGYYPVLCWTAYLCAGLAAGRLDLAARAVQVRVAAAGAGLALAGSGASALLLGPLGGLERIGATTVLEPGRTLAQTVAETRYGSVPTTTPWWLAVDAPHTSTPPDLLHTTGTSLLVLGLCLLVAPHAIRLLRPLAAAGGMSLTLYALHVLVMESTDPDRAGLAWGLQVAGGLVLAVTWLAAFHRGPLETLVAAVVRVLLGRRRADRPP